MEKILVVEDDQLFCEDLKLFIEGNYQFEFVHNKEDALLRLYSDPPDLVLLDLKLKKEFDGLEIFEKILSDFPFLPVIIITQYKSIPLAVSLIKKGAYDFFDKSMDFARLNFSIKNALKISRLQRKILEIEEKEGEILVGESGGIKRVRKMIQLIADKDLPVLITGETGVGKELVARLIHKMSKRKGNFIKINCPSIPETLFESELFGFRKGAFTGAFQHKLGKVELAEGGTLFLDEIAEIPLALQAKLLRLVERKEIEVIGGREKKVDVRILAATNKNLEEEVKKGRFRKDLYYRLAVFVIYVPPLRERKEDIPLLVNYFINKYSKKLGKKLKGIEENAIEKLLKYDWEGNVRELENVIQRAVIISRRDQITARDIVLFEKNNTANLLDYEEILPYKEARERVLRNFKKHYLRKVLKITGGNITKAAELLKIPRQSLQKMLREIKEENCKV